MRMECLPNHLREANKREVEDPIYDVLNAMGPLGTEVLVGVKGRPQLVLGVKIRDHREAMKMTLISI